MNLIKLHNNTNKATRSPEISRQQVQKLTPQFLFSKNHTKFKQHSINIKNYTAHPHDMLHVPAKF